MRFSQSSLHVADRISEENKRNFGRVSYTTKVEGNAMQAH